MDRKELDHRELWQKLLDPIRELYGDDPASDLELLKRVVYDQQVILGENEKLHAIAQSQAKVMRRHGWGGYGPCNS